MHRVASIDRHFWVRRLGADRLGFTLIEMLVVMSIVALLLTIALPRYFGSLGKAKDTVLQENLQVIRATLDKYYADKGQFPDTLSDLVEQKYLRAMPVDPVTESSQTWILVPPRDPELKGVGDVKSGAPGKANDGRPYDAF